MTTDVAARYAGRPARTPERPMGFTAGEFARGAALAWLLFMLIAPLGFGTVAVAIAGAAPEDAVAGGFLYGVYGGIVLAPWALGALVVGSPFALLLALRADARRATASVPVPVPPAP